jgi:hypothetical protein
VESQSRILGRAEGDGTWGQEVQDGELCGAWSGARYYSRGKECGRHGSIGSIVRKEIGEGKENEDKVIIASEAVAW